MDWNYLQGRPKPSSKGCLLYTSLPGIGDNGEPNIEKIIELEPDVILAIDSLKIGVDELQEKTNIPVVSIPIADSSLDEKNHEIFRILGEMCIRDSITTMFVI